jgi:hypothetical protein
LTFVTHTYDYKWEELKIIKITQDYSCEKWTFSKTYTSWNDSDTGRCISFTRVIFWNWALSQLLCSSQQWHGFESIGYEIKLLNKLWLLWLYIYIYIYIPDCGFGPRYSILVYIYIYIYIYIYKYMYIYIYINIYIYIYICVYVYVYRYKYMYIYI